MESESGTTNTKISDSGYCNTCTNSNSQRSASSKSRHSGSNSSRSSGYCGTVNADGSVHTVPQPPKRNKDKTNKKKKLKTTNLLPTIEATSISTPTTKTEARNTSTTDIQDLITESEMGIPATVTESVVPAEDIEGKIKPVVTTVSTHVEVTESDLITNIMFQTCLKSCIIIVCTAETPPPEEDTSGWKELNEVKPIEEVRQLDINEPVVETIKTSSCPENGFCCIISMHDGVVLYTTPSLTTVLGFPKDMWLGRSFIDFVHPKDRETFSSQVATGIALPLVNSQGKYTDYKNCLYVCLRKYRGLKSSGFGVIERAVSYQAFQLTVKFKHITDTPDTKHPETIGGMFLVVMAVPVYSSYQVPHERTKSPKFCMRHTSACIFSHVDPDIVNNFGFLPQDMLGKSIFDFYHPEDMPFLKQVYESVMRMCQIAGSVFRSKPYRFAVQNGGFAMIETEWSSFVNPWSRRLEFVIGLHRVIQGPPNPNIFEPFMNEENKIISDEIVKESQVVQNEILLLLNKELPRPSEAAKHQVSKRCQDLANFMETLMDEVKTSNLYLDLPQAVQPTVSVSFRRMERDSVMLGEISPHHDYYDSKSSSETPPSYNQLNYHENIQRFFESKPKTTVSDGSNNGLNGNDTEQDGKPQERTNNQKCLSPTENSGTSGTGSAESFVSNPNLESGTTSGTNTSNGSYKPTHLTESLLVREQRSSTKDREGKKTHHKLEKANIMERGGFDRLEQNVAAYSHGVKRCGSHSREGDNHKLLKHKHPVGISSRKEETGLVKPAHLTNFDMSNPPTHGKIAANENMYRSEMNDINLWPPFSLTVTPMNNTQSYSMNTTLTGPSSFATGVLPLYYIPSAQQAPISGQFNTYEMNFSRYHVIPMPGMMYNYNSTLYPTSPVVCPTLPVVPVPMVPPSSIPCVRPISSLQQQVDTNPSSTAVMTELSEPVTPFGTQFQIPASQHTSVKAEPGSAIGSIASVSVANKNIYSLVGRLPKSEIVNLFRDHNVSQTTIYRAIRDCEEGIPCINLPKTGRPHVLSQNRVNRLVESAHDRVGISSRKLGRRFGVSYKTVLRTLSRNNVRFRKRRKCPKYTQGQLERIPRCCRSLRRTHFVRNRVIIMDDEKYFTLSHSEMKDNDGYYTSDVENCPNEVKFKAKAKFADKVLVWCAISEAGILAPYVGRVRGEAALSQCSRKDMGWQSVCSPNSPLVSPPVCETNIEAIDPNANKVDSKLVVYKYFFILQLKEAIKNNYFLNSNNNNIVDEESSCYSSSYYSFLKNDTGSGSNDESNIMENKARKGDHMSWDRKNYPSRKKDPPWVESVSVSPDLIYRYQVTIRDLEDVLEADLNVLRKLSQPEMVNDQLNQLYIDMELEGLSKKLSLEEGITSSSSSDENSTIYKPYKKKRSYGSLVMIYEENAPLPPPTSNN
ncbi:hypothetical protein NQ317_002422 [Molorchus minor]|uniref:Period circadian protein n=1 Tax=Molorchus minor TaxID=1323400 RepID=A0ABQ9JLN7_9CUCU|nr:hypothetical protein NQ317_002422 [Molorchus minor]